MNPPPLAPPFPLEHQLMSARDEPIRTVPGHPHIPLDDPTRVRKLLLAEFCSNDVDKVAERLWWMSKQDSRNISPLHRQLVKGRSIVVTEDPKLHLVWIYDRVFIKPLPRFMGSHAFWKEFLCKDTDSKGRGARIHRAALGYLRTYYYLIQHESDLRIATDQNLCLVRANTTWEEFCAFRSSLCDITDQDVSLRYAYGEIRLTRLNFYAPFILGKSHFQRVEYQYGQYFARFYGPLLFVFGVISVTLSGFQVVLSVDTTGPGWMKAVSGISITAIVVSCGSLLYFAVILVYKVANEWNYALRDRRRLAAKERTTV